MEDDKCPFPFRFIEAPHFGLGPAGGDHEVSMYDADARRQVRVNVPNTWGWDPPEDDDPEFDVPARMARDALTKYLDELPSTTIRIRIDKAGNLLSFEADPERDFTMGTDYPLLQDYQLPPAIADRTILRSELTEIRRICTGIDLVSYPPSLVGGPLAQDKNCFVFKYQPSDFISMWTEIQILARLPPHPHIVLLDRLVLDEMTGTQVVGFTMRYIPSKTLESQRPPFKMKWLRQLTQTVDDLNLKHGIIHQDIAGRNLLIDPDTDSIALIDFNVSCRVGTTKRKSRDYEGKWAGRDDVKGVLVFVYEYITRDPALAGGLYMLHTVDESKLIDPAKWVKHPSVELDDEVAEFYFELMAWVRRRRAGKQLEHYSEAPEHFEWPHVDEIENMGRYGRYGVAEMRRAGLPYLNWRRPVSSKVDPTRPLLATGRYADEEAAAQKAIAKAVAFARENPGKKPIIGRLVHSDEVAPAILWEPGQKIGAGPGGGKGKGKTAAGGRAAVKADAQAKAGARAKSGARAKAGVRVKAAAKVPAGAKVRAGAKAQAGAEPGGRVLRPRLKREKEVRADTGASAAAPCRAVKRRKLLPQRSAKA